jgi:hypothetical protein
MIHPLDSLGCMNTWGTFLANSFAVSGFAIVT